MELAVIFGVYLGGSVVVAFFWSQGGETLGERDISLYKGMMVAWPMYVIAIMLYRVIKYFKGDMYG